MAPRHRIALGAVCAALGATVFVGLSVALAWWPELTAVDEAFAAALAADLPAGAVRAAAVLTRAGDPSTLVTVGVAVGAWLAWRRHGALLGVWTVTLLGNGVLNPALKQAFERARPWPLLDAPPAHGFSFPSGHSSGAVVVCGMLAWLALRLLPHSWHLPALSAAVLMALGIAATRVLLGVHYLSDVVAGLAWGLTWLSVCLTGHELLRRASGQRGTAVAGRAPDAARPRARDGTV